MQQYQSLLLIALVGVVGALRLDRGEEKAEAAAQARLQFLNSLAGKQEFDKYEKVVHREALDRQAILETAEQIGELREEFYDETGHDMDEDQNDNEPLEMTHDVEEAADADLDEVDSEGVEADSDSDDDAVGMVAFLQMQEHYGDDHIDLQKAVNDADREVAEAEDRDERMEVKDEELSELHNQELDIAKNEQDKADREEQELEEDEEARDERYDASEKDAEEELDEVKETADAELEEEQAGEKEVAAEFKREGFSDQQ